MNKVNQKDIVDCFGDGYPSFNYELGRRNRDKKTFVDIKAGKYRKNRGKDELSQ